MDKREADCLCQLLMDHASGLVFACDKCRKGGLTLCSALVRGEWVITTPSMRVFHRECLEGAKR
jgi:hypothetical protein